MKQLRFTSSFYGSRYMPLPVHKLLKHGDAISKESLLPIEALSEEALEVGKKDEGIPRAPCKEFSRVSNNEDIFRRLLLTPNPDISIISGGKKTKSAHQVM